jgi:hypothetical protein
LQDLRGVRMWRGSSMLHQHSALSGPLVFTSAGGLESNHNQLIYVGWAWLQVSDDVCFVCLCVLVWHPCRPCLLN